MSKAQSFRLFLFLILASQALTVHAQTWTPFTPPGGGPRGGDASQGTAYDATTDRLIVFGGYNPTANPCCAENNDVWVLMNASGAAGVPTWQQVFPNAPAGLPTARQAHSAVYDPSTNRMIIFGGGQFGGGAFSTLFQDTWVLTFANNLGGTPEWIPLSPSGGPPAPREGHAAVLNQATNEMFVFGGGNNGIMSVPNDLWVLENANGIGTPAWIQLSETGNVPSPLENFASAYDPVLNHWTVIGGCCGYTNASRVLALNQPPGASQWTNLFPSGSLLPPAGDALIYGYDPVSNTLIVNGIQPGGGGNSTWLLTDANASGATPAWINLIPEGAAGSPPEGANPVGSAYNPATKKFIRALTVVDAQGNFLPAVWVLSNADGTVPPSTHTLTVASTNPAAGVPIIVSLSDNNNLSDGSTQFTRNYNTSSQITLTAPATASGNTFSSWSGCDSTSSSVCSMTINSDRLAVVNYVTPPPPPPIIISISPGSAFQGQTLSVMIAGLNFLPNAQISFDPLGITVVQSTLTIAQTQVNASIRVSPAAPIGSYALTVSNPDGQTATLSGAFAVSALLPPSPPQGFLSFPLPLLNVDTAAITSVFDHHDPANSQTGAPLFYVPGQDGYVVDFKGEEGSQLVCSDGEKKTPSYCNVITNKKGGSRPFVVNGNYQNDTGNNKLSYDGHSGYDFVYPDKSTFRAPILAPADGRLFIPDQDPITRPASENAAKKAPDVFAIMAIDHGNGFVSWYLHAGCLEGTTSADGKIVCDLDEDYRGLINRKSGQRVCPLATMKSTGCVVHRGDVIGLAGNMGLSPSTSVAHLHFEIRVGLVLGSNGLPVCDLIESLCRPIDPYGWSPTPNAPVQLDPYSVYLNGAQQLMLWQQ